MCTWMIASRSLLLAQAHTQHTFIIIINTPHIPKFHTSTQVYSSTYIHAPTIPACKSAHSKINKNKYKIKKKMERERLKMKRREAPVKSKSRSVKVTVTPTSRGVW